MSTHLEESKLEKSRLIILLHSENIYEQSTNWFSHINWIILFGVENSCEIVFGSIASELINIWSGEVWKFFDNIIILPDSFINILTIEVKSNFLVLYDKDKGKNKFNKINVKIWKKFLTFKYLFSTNLSIFCLFFTFLINLIISWFFSFSKVKILHFFIWNNSFLIVWFFLFCLILKFIVSSLIRIILGISLLFISLCLFSIFIMNN